jgi:hypothetical protein
MFTCLILRPVEVKATYYSEISARFYLTARRHLPLFISCSSSRKILKRRSEMRTNTKEFEEWLEGKYEISVSERVYSHVKVLLSSARSWHSSASRGSALLGDRGTFLSQLSRCSNSSALGLARILNNLGGSPHQFQLVNSGFVQFQTCISLLITSAQKRGYLAVKIIYSYCHRISLRIGNFGTNQCHNYNYNNDNIESNMNSINSNHNWQRAKCLVGLT